MDKKATIISVARRHFSRYGYTKTTMEEIARDCKITKPTLYTHFAGKIDLFSAVIESEQSKCYEMIADTESKNMAASAKLISYAEMQIQSLKKFLLIGELSRQAFLDLHPDVLKVYTTYRLKEENILMRWIEEGIRSNEFSHTDSKRTARVFYLTIAALKYDALVLHNNNSEEFSDEEIIIESLLNEINNFVEIFLNGLKKRIPVI